MTEIFLLRHAHVDYGEGIAITAQNPLTALGHHMAERLAMHCESLGLEILFVSTMPRAQQTADAISRRFPDLPRVDLADLEELSIKDLADHPSPPDENMLTWELTHFCAADQRAWERVARAWAFIEAMIAEQRPGARRHRLSCRGAQRIAETIPRRRTGAARFSVV